MENKRSLKVLQVLVGGNWAGGAAVVHPFVKRLIEEGYEVWVLCLTDEVARRFKEIGARTIQSNRWNRQIALSDISAFLELIKICRLHRFDIVHAHTSKGGLFGRLAAFLMRVPIIIYTVHGFTFNEFSPALQKLFYAFLEILASPFCDLTIAVSNGHRRLAVRYKLVRPGRIITIHNGIDVKCFRTDLNRDYRSKMFSCPAGSILVGTVGRLVASKGPEYLLRAIPSVIDRYPQARIVFIGAGPQQAELIALSKRLGVSEFCEWLGFRWDIPELLACLDVFVLPSPREGLSVAIIEAMASARPIVATDITGNRDLIDSGLNGILVEPGNPLALSNAIIDLIANREFAKTIGNRARKRVEQSFTVDKMVERNLQAYDALCKSKIVRYSGISCFRRHAERDKILKAHSDNI